MPTEDYKLLLPEDIHDEEMSKILRDYMRAREAWAEFMLRNVCRPTLKMPVFNARKLSRWLIKWKVSQVQGANGNWWFIQNRRLLRPSFGEWARINIKAAKLIEQEKTIE